MFVVESSATGWEIKFRSIAFTDTFTLPVRTGSGGGVVVVVVEEESRLLTRMVKALARDMLKAKVVGVTICCL